MRIRLCRPLSLSSLFSFSYFLIYINPMLLSFYKVSKFCSIFSKMVSDSCVIFLIDYFTTSSQNYKSIIIIKKPSLKTELNKKKKKTHTVKQMLGKSIIRHVLSNQQPLISITAVPNQIGQPLMPQLPYSPCLLLQHPPTKKTIKRSNFQTNPTFLTI